MSDSESRRTQSSKREFNFIDFGEIPAGSEIGAILRERREAMGVSIEEVEAATRIRPKYLAAMESDEWHLLPGEIVGRGFLRNYAAYLDLEPEEMLSRRNSTIDSRLATSLRNTSAGSALPPIREVNYRPKELDLKDEPEGIEGSSSSIRGLLPILLVGLFAILLWQGFDLIQGLVSTVGDGLQARIEEFRQTPEPTATSVAVVSNGGEGDNGDQSAVVVPTSLSVAPDNSLITDTIQNSGNTAQVEIEPTPAAAVIPPTPAPTPIPPTPVPPTPIPPTPIPPTPIPPPPTDTPVPLVVAPVCPDSRAIITTPGEGQIVSGAVEITGSATHESFQFYKLEYAAGANATQGWAYFDGGNSPVAQGRLGALNTPSLANGQYTLQLVVVDLSANFPPPCRVNITIQN